MNYSNEYKTKNLFKKFFIFLISTIVLISAFSFILKNNVNENNDLKNDLKKTNSVIITKDGITTIYFEDITYNPTYYAKYDYDSSVFEGEESRYDFLTICSHIYDSTLDDGDYNFVKLVSLDLDITNFTIAIDWDKEVYKFSYDYSFSVEHDRKAEDLMNYPDREHIYERMKFKDLLNRTSMSLINGYANDKDYYKIEWKDDSSYNFSINGHITNNGWSENQNEGWTNEFNYFDSENRVGIIELDIFYFSLDFTKNLFYHNPSWGFKYIGGRNLEIHFDDHYIVIDNI